METGLAYEVFPPLHTLTSQWQYLGEGGTSNSAPATIGADKFPGDPLPLEHRWIAWKTLKIAIRHIYPRIQANNIQLGVAVKYPSTNSVFETKQFGT
jgi:hypothetical protein